MRPVRLLKSVAIGLGIILFLIALIIIALPFVIELKPLQDRIENAVRAKSGVDLRLDHLELAYLPQPALRAASIEVKKGTYSFMAQDVTMVPDIVALILRNRPPLSAIRFKKGEVAGVLRLNDGEVSISQNRVEFESRCRLYKECNFSIVGRADLRTRALEVTLEGQGARLDQLAKRLFNFKRLPVISLGAYRVALKTNLSGLSPLRIRIHHLKVVDPALTLRGRLLVDTSLAERFFQVDLEASSVDATRLRTVFKKAFPKEKAVKETVEIIRGGTFDHFRMRFQGSVEDAKHFKNYTIWAGGRDVTIFIPKIGLTLQDVAGEVEIKNEVLKGQGLVARLRETQAKECSIQLDLGGKNKHLKFNGTLKAPGDDILWAVKRFVKEPKVLEWANKIAPVGGYARGKLELYGPLKHLHARILARPHGLKAKITGYPYTIVFDGGEFDLDTVKDRITLNEIRGHFGKTSWKGLKGLVQWGKRTHLNLSIEGGSLDLSEAHSLAINSFHLKKALSAFIKKADGNVRFRRIELEFDPKDIGEIRYRLEPTGGKGHIESPRIPMPLNFSNLMGAISNGEIALKGLSIGFRDSTHLSFSRLKVRYTKNGVEAVSAAASGRLGDGLGKWVFSRSHVPEEFLPKLPLEVQGLHIDITGKGKEVALEAGLKRPVKGATSPISVTLAFKKGPHDISLERLHIKGPKTDAHMVFKVEEATKNKGTGALEFSFKGALAGADLNHLLQRNSLLMGELQGDLTLRTGAVPRPAITGDIMAKGLLWHWGIERPVFVEELDAHRHGSTLKVARLTISQGASVVSGNGTISSHSDGLTILFHAKEGRVNVDAAISLFGHKPLPTTGPKGSKMPTTSWVIPQRPAEKFKWPRIIRDMILEFHIQEAYYNKKTIKEPQGVLAVSKDGRISLDLYSSILCGLHAALSLELSHHTPYTIMKVWTQKEEGGLPDFQDTLPCLGLSREILSGPIRLNMTLRGRPGDWDEGTFQLNGGPGVIQKSNIITKIFSVINVIDLFSRYSSIFSSGLPYSSLLIKGAVKGDEIAIERVVLKAEGLNFFGRGSVYLTPETVDLFVLVSPFKTIDLILSKIPIIGYAIGGRNHTLITVPLKVSGPLQDPSVTILHPEAIGKGMLDLIKNIISIPVRIVVPENLQK